MAQASRTESAGNVARLRDALPPEWALEREIFYPLLECAAAALKIERIRKYSVAEMLSQVRAGQRWQDNRIATIRDTMTQPDSVRLTRRIDELTRRARDIAAFKEPPYFYYRLIETVLSRRAPRFLRKRFLAFYPRVKAGVLFMQLLSLLPHGGEHNQGSAG